MIFKDNNNSNIISIISITINNNIPPIIIRVFLKSHIDRFKYYFYVRL